MKAKVVEISSIKRKRYNSLILGDSPKYDTAPNETDSEIENQNDQMFIMAKFAIYQKSKNRKPKQI